jgi:2-polyprenyl-3-methyl-5-hydroxy-6-metoxy-1,4-benzoquinol methylase
MPTGQELTDYYQGFEFGLPTPAAMRTHASLIGENVERIVEDLRSVGCQFGSALDFGGSVGYYANAFADHFETVDLFDLDRAALAKASALFPERFGVCTTDSLRVPRFSRTYDLIFANQVIEHYTDLSLFFSTLRDAAHENTIFVITTPNNRTANIWVRPEILLHYVSIGAVGIADRLRNLCRLARNSWACCDPPRHVVAFNSDNLKSIAERNALKTISVASVYCTDDYYSPAKYRPEPVRDLRSLMTRIENLVVRPAVRLMRAVDRGSVRGDDIVLLARLANGTS